MPADGDASDGGATGEEPAAAVPCPAGCRCARRMDGAADPAVSGRRLGGGPDALSAGLPLLESALAVTANETAMLSETGVYAEPSRVGGPLHHRPGRIEVRVHPPTLRTVVAAHRVPGDGIPPALHAFDRHGATAHRAFGLSAADELVLESLGRLDDDGFGRLDALVRDDRHRPGDASDLDPLDHTGFADELWDGADPFAVDDPARHEPTRWQDADQLQHLDGVLAGHDGARHAALLALPPERARRIDPTLVGLILSHLAQVPMPVAVGVHAPGFLQVHRSRIAAMEHRDGAITAFAGAATLVVDPLRIAECWVVRSPGVHGLCSSVELVTAGGRFGAFLTQLGAVGDHVAAAWEDLTLSLPDLD